MNHEGAQNYFRWGEGVLVWSWNIPGEVTNSALLLQLQHFQLTSILGSKVEVLKQSESLEVYICQTGPWLPLGCICEPGSLFRHGHWALGVPDCIERIQLGNPSTAEKGHFGSKFKEDSIFVLTL